MYSRCLSQGVVSYTIIQVLLTHQYQRRQTGTRNLAVPACQVFLAWTAAKVVKRFGQQWYRFNFQLQPRLRWEIPLCSSPSSLSSSSSSSFTSSLVTIYHISTINDLFHSISIQRLRLRVRQQPAFARPSTNSWKLCDLKSWGLCAAQKESTCGCFQK